MTPLLQRLSQGLGSPRLHTGSPGLFIGQAAVMALVTDHPTSPELVFTLRSLNLSSHAGQVAFPGGKWEPQDPDLLATGLRETHEEIALPPSQIRVLGSIASRSTSTGTLVTPFVGVIAHSAALVPDPNEIQSVFRAPLDWFEGAEPIRVDVYRRQGVDYQIPAYNYGGYEIWGFTAAVTIELLALMAK